MYNGFEVTYDMDGNMVSNSESVFDYDSSNRLVRMDGHFYTYNAEDVRIKCVCDDKETTYTYNTNCKLSQLLTKTTNGVVTKYVYGLGLIGEEASNTFRTYHFDFRGSTVAVTDASGTVTDTFAYDTYGKCIARTGTSDIIFGYNGRDGVVTDTNGLCYMRARYYSPDMRRFINADIIAGKISNAVTLNRYAYANGNPVSNVDPFGLTPDRNSDTKESEFSYGSKEYIDILCSLMNLNIEARSRINDINDILDIAQLISGNVKFIKKGDYIIVKGSKKVLSKYGIKQRRIRASNIEKFEGIDDLLGSQTFKNGFKNSFDTPGVVLDTIGVVTSTIYEVNQYEDVEDKLIIGAYTATTEIISNVATAAVSAGTTALVTKICTAAGTAIAPGVGTAIGFVAGFVTGLVLDSIFKHVKEKHIKKIVDNN